MLMPKMGIDDNTKFFLAIIYFNVLSRLCFSLMWVDRLFRFNAKSQVGLLLLNFTLHYILVVMSLYYEFFWELLYLAHSLLWIECTSP